MQRFEIGATSIVVEPGGRAAGRETLRQLIAEIAGVPAANIELTATCPDCGGPHGQLVVSAPRAATFVRVSVSYAGENVVVAASTVLIGVDAEPRDDAAAHAAAITEVAGPSANPVRHWTRIEAVLKAVGSGLRRDPRAVHIEGSMAHIDDRAFELHSVGTEGELEITVAIAVE